MWPTPELAGLLPVLYPGVFPNLAAPPATGAPRADLLAHRRTASRPVWSPASRTTPVTPSRTCCA